MMDHAHATPADAPSRARPGSAAVALAVFAGCPFVMALGPKLFTGASVVAVLALIAARLMVAPRPRPAWPSAPSLMLFGLLAWAGLSLLWSPVPERSAHLWSVLAMVGAVAIAGLEASRQPPSPAARAVLFKVLLFVVCLVLCVYCANYLTDMSVYWAFYDLGWQDKIPFEHTLNRGLSFLALVAWPLLAWLLACRAWMMLAALLGGLILTLMLGSSAAAMAAFVCGAGAAALGALLSPAAIRWGLRTLALVAALAGPWLLTQGPAQHREGFHEAPSSVLARLEILALYADPLAARPVLGWGIGSATEAPLTPIAPELYVGSVALQEGTPPAGAFFHIDPASMAVHPHNNFVEIWLELGVVGVLLVAGLAWWTAGRIGHLPGRLDRAAASGAFVGIMLIACSAYGVWQEDWLGHILFIAVLARLGLPHGSARPAAQG